MTHAEREAMLGEIDGIAKRMCSDAARSFCGTGLTYEDLLQECLCVLWQAMGRYDSSKAKLSTYAGTIVINCINELYRRSRRRGRIILPQFSLEDAEELHESKFGRYDPEPPLDGVFGEMERYLARDEWQQFYDYYIMDKPLVEIYPGLSKSGRQLRMVVLRNDVRERYEISQRSKAAYAGARAQ